MSSYREKWFENNKSITGRYKCVRWGKRFKKEDVDIDHILPKKYGGSDHISNLQCLCRHWNRSKQADLDDTLKDYTKNAVRNTVKGTSKALGKMLIKKLK